MFELIRGRLDILGKRLTLDEGRIDLRGAFDPYLRFVASTESEDATLRVVMSTVTLSLARSRCQFSYSSLMTTSNIRDFKLYSVFSGHIFDHGDVVIGKAGLFECFSCCLVKGCVHPAPVTTNRFATCWHICCHPLIELRGCAFRSNVRCSHFGPQDVTICPKYLVRGVCVPNFLQAFLVQRNA